MAKNTVAHSSIAHSRTTRYCVQSTARSLTTPTLSRTQPTLVRRKMCPEKTPLPHNTNSVRNTAFCRATQIVSRAKPTLYDTNCVQSKAHTLTTHLCPEQSPHPSDTNCAQSTAHSHSRLLTSCLPNTNILIFCSPLVVYTTCRNLRKLRFATQIIYAFSVIHAVYTDYFPKQL